MPELPWHRGSGFAAVRSRSRQEDLRSLRLRWPEAADRAGRGGCLGCRPGRAL